MAENATQKPRYTLQTIFREMERLAGSDFPKSQLRNRLLNLGLKEVISKRGSIIRKNGFPFKFNRQLDEAILALAHFLDRFRNEVGSLDIYALNRVSKAEDKTLSFWQDAKTKLYLELQNLILLLNDRGSRKSSISRIFAFRELSDLAFLSQGAINVLAEHLAIGVKVGFMFQDSFDTSDIVPISDTIIINFIPRLPTPRKHNFFELYMLGDETKRYDLPYQEFARAKWYKDQNDAKTSRPELPRLGRLLALFNSEWQRLSPANSHHICKFENEGHFFNDATLMMYRAFVDSEFQKQQKEADEQFIDRVNKTVITRDMIRLHRTMSAFDGAQHIRAVDATSTKSSLKIHETRPTYRDWLRRSLNRVLRSQENTLHRIYILDDHPDDKGIEYQTLLRLMQYYLDYFHYEIAEMAAIVHKSRPTRKSLSTNFRDQEWFQDQWKSFPDRVSIHVTTSGVLQRFTDTVLTEEMYPQMFRSLLPTSEARPTKHEYLAILDYLSTESMIYNFLDPRGDPDELTFPASWFRESLPKDEEDILFKFTKLKSLLDLQTLNRINLLGASVLKYEEDYGEILGAAIIEDIRKAINTGQVAGVDLKPKDLLKLRAAIEKKLYHSLKPHFDYLHKVLEYQSVKVDFWTKDKESLIHKISPFKDCEDASSLTQLIEAKVSGRLRKGEPLPKLATPQGDKMEQKAKVFLSYASEDVTKVDELYQRLTEANFAPWQDTRDIPGGANPRRSIEQAIKRSDFFVPCLSDNSAEKRGFVQRELNQALDIWKGMLRDDIYLVPVRLDNCQVPEDLKENFQYIDLFKDGSWNEDGWNRLLNAIGLGLERRTS